MQALVLNNLKSPLRLEERPDLEPGAGEAVVQLRAAALNRRDYWITQGLYPGINTPVVLGSDGAGSVVKTGRGMGNFWQNREVIINPGWDWGPDTEVQSDAFRILGMPDDGTFATMVKVPQEYLHEKPAHLNWQEAAALPLAGVTAYRALFTRGKLGPAQTVLINGVGGGVASLVMQLAVAEGAQTLVTSSSSEKRERALALGAAAAFDYREDRWIDKVKSNHGSVHLIVDSAGGEGYNTLLELAAPGGRIVNYGATAGAPKKMDLFKVFWKQLQLLGSTMGSPADFKQMLDFIERHKLRPIVDHVYPLADGNAAVQRMQDARQFGKLVLEM